MVTIYGHFGDIHGRVFKVCCDLSHGIYFNGMCTVIKYMISLRMT